MASKTNQPVKISPQQFTSYRNQLGLTKTALAAELGMHRKQITRYEAGEIEVPTVTILALRYLIDKQSLAG